MEKKTILCYKDLIVWQKSMELAESVYKLTRKLPKSEDWGLIAQIRRSAISIPSNIAEGYGRETSGNYKQFLSISRGSLFELETQISLCVKLNYIKPEDVVSIYSAIVEISKMLTSLISKIH